VDICRPAAAFQQGLASEMGDENSNSVSQWA
jgi:hypothetical protein